MKKVRKNFRFYHIHVLDFLRSLVIGIVFVALLIGAGKGITYYFSSQENIDSLQTFVSFLPVEENGLLKETFLFLDGTYPSAPIKKDWQPLLSILSDSLPTFSSLSFQIQLLQAHEGRGDISPPLLLPEILPETPSVPSAPTEELPPGALPIKNITISPQISEGYQTVGNVYINNQTTYDVNIEELLAAPLPFTYQKGKIQVLVVHTHGTESFTPEGKTFYTEEDTNRSLDEEENILKIGTEITKRLTAAGIGVIHNTTIHDSPSFNGSYSNAEKTIVQELKDHPSICIVLDIHRDAMITAEGVKYRPIIHGDDKDFAQVMLVMGTDEGGLTHKNWRKNLSFAVKVQKGLNDLIPDLARPLYLKKERFNEHTTTGSMLIEMGASGNYQSDVLNTVEPLCEVLINTIKKIS